MNTTSTSSHKTQLLENIVDNSPAIAFIWQLTEGWPVVYVSKNISQLGYTTEEFINGDLKFEQMVHHDDLVRVTNEVSENIGNKVEKFLQQYRIINKQ